MAYVHISVYLELRGELTGRESAKILTPFSTAKMAPFGQKIALALALAAAAQATMPLNWENVVLDPAPYTTWVATSSDGLSRRAQVDVPFVNASGVGDMISYSRVDLVGNAQQRGFAQGELFAQDIYNFYTEVLPDFVIGMADDVLPGVLPPDLEAKVQAAIATKVPAAAYAAMDWVWQREAKHVPARLVTEMEAMGEGLCAGLATSMPDYTCDPVEWGTNIKQVNMFPELIKMTCTMFGAWGEASKSSDLFQLRALDFGGGPLAELSQLQVHRQPPGAPVPVPTPGQDTPGNMGNDAGDLWQGFASIGFPGLVGVITGVSEKGIGLSEKVWEVYNSSTGVQKGHYDGEADVLVMRDVLELAPNRSSAELYMRNDPDRTFAVFLGVGDRETQQMDICGYREADFHAYTPETMPDVTGQPYMKDLVYVDKHPQPSHDLTELPDLLTAHYGAIDQVTTAAIAAGHETGDLHIAMYDYSPGSEALWFSIGRTNAAGDYGQDSVWKACYRPYLHYPLEALFAGQ